jgi:hypothetical protein
MIGNSNKKLFLLLPCVPLIGMGQDYKIDKSPFKIGLEFGPSITSVRGSLSSSELPNGQQVELYNNQTFCFSGGLSFEYSLQKRFSIKTNILYERKVAFMDTTFTDITGNVILKYNPGHNYDYLTIPILAKY